MVYGGDDYNVSLSPNLWIMSFDLDLDLDLGLTIYHDSNLSNHDEIYVIAYHHKFKIT